MKKNMWFILALALVSGPGFLSCAKPAASDGDVSAVTDSSFEKEVLKSDKPVFVDFWATWCGPCRMYGPIVDRLAHDYKGRLKVVRVDIDQNPELARSFHIQAIPSSFLLEKGNVVKSWVGLVSEDDLKEGVDQVLPLAAPGPPSKS